MRKQKEIEKYFNKASIALVVVLIVFLLLAVAGMKYYLLQPLLLKYAHDTISLLRIIYASGWIVGISVLIGNLIYFRYCYRYIKIFWWTGLLIVCICSFMVIFMDYVILVDCKYFQNMSIISEEIDNVKNDSCLTKELYLKESKIDDSDISLLFYQKDSNKVKTYQVAADVYDSAGMSDKIYVPDYLNFSLDEDNPYGDSSSVEANKAYAAVYRVTYTPNLNLVVDIETLPPKELDWNLVEFNGLEDAGGYNKAITNKENLSWNNNQSHIEFKSGKVMDFSWMGPGILGSMIGAEKNHFIFTYNDVSYKHQLHAFIIEDYYDGLFEAAKAMSKDEWIKNMHIPYQDGIYEIEETEKFFRVLIGAENGEEKGYAVFIIGRDEEIAYGFSYMEDIESYNEKRARKIIDSISVIKGSK